jgi:hypothetical protein
MKKFLIATTLILGLTVAPIYAQNDQLPPDSGISREEDEQIVDEEVEIQIQQNDGEDTMTEDEMEEETQEQIEDGTLSQDLDIQQSSNISLPSILLAVLTPALLISVAYMLIKMSNK